MRFLRQQFFNDDRMCDWVRRHHLSSVSAVPFGSFNLIGMDDSPAEIHLYTPKTPAYNEMPVQTYDDVDGVMTLRPPAVKRKRVVVVEEVVAAPKTESGPMRYVG